MFGCLWGSAQRSARSNVVFVVRAPVLECFATWTRLLRIIIFFDDTAVFISIDFFPFACVEPMHVRKGVECV